MTTSIRIARDTLVGGTLGWAVAHAVAPRLIPSLEARSWVEGGTALLVAAAFAALSVHRRLERPLDAMTQTLRRSVPGDLLPPVPSGGTDETYDLAAALEHFRAGCLERFAQGIRERDRLLEVLEEMPMGLFELDEGGRIVFQNRVAREFLGTDDRALGRAPVETIRSGELQEMVDAALQDRVARTIDITLVEPTRRLLHVHAFPLESGLIVITEDVTRVRRLEKARSEMVANIGHELRTPLAAILGYLETLGEPGLGAEDRARFLAVIARNARRLERLVRDLSHLSRLESSPAARPATPVDLGVVAAAVLETLAPRIRAQTLRIRAEIPAGLPGVLADRDGLETVLQNLLDNAVRSTPPGGTITVGARAEEEGIQFWVEDTGPGIPRDLRERVFERFYRMDPGRNAGEGGSGLGLAIVKHTLLQYGGHVAVEEGSGGGARFVAWLPGETASQEDKLFPRNSLS
jgi:two-component system, OmpR family, phosphate regulon sensor histidine kinase PhoR